MSLIREQYEELLGEVSRLRAELASFKENGCDGCELPLWWAEAIKLRAELAAEKERCAGFVLNLLDRGLIYGPLADTIIAAIRGSNADPPQTEVEAVAELKRHIKEAEDKFYVLSFYINDPVANKCALDKCNQMRRALGKVPMDFGPDMVRPRYAAPPHVEPSAAESERAKSDPVWAFQAQAREDWWREKGPNFDPYAKAATEARMVELAQIVYWEPSNMLQAEKLAALVIETFGEKS